MWVRSDELAVVPSLKTTPQQWIKWVFSHVFVQCTIVVSLSMDYHQMFEYKWEKGQVSCSSLLISVDKNRFLTPHKNVLLCCSRVSALRNKPFDALVSGLIHNIEYACSKQVDQKFSTVGHSWQTFVHGGLKILRLQAFFANQTKVIHKAFPKCYIEQNKFSFSSDEENYFLLWRLKLEQNWKVPQSIFYTFFMTFFSIVV